MSIQRLSKTISAGALATLNTIPVTLVPAPGLSKVIVPRGQFVVNYRFVTTAYPNSVHLRIGNLTSATLWLNLVTDLTYTQSKIASQAPSAIAFTNLTTFSNLPLLATLDAAAGNATTGPIVGTTLISGGSAYVVGDNILLNEANSSSDAWITVSTVSGSGAILTFVVTYAGLTYSQAPGDQPATGIDGGVRSLAIRTAGATYVVGDVLNVSSGSGNAKYTVDAIDGSGAVTVGHLSSPGDGYATANNQSTNYSTGSMTGSGLTLDVVASVGTGLSMTITSVQTTGDGYLVIDFDYQILAVA